MRNGDLKSGGSVNVSIGGLKWSCWALHCRASIFYTLCYIFQILYSAFCIFYILHSIFCIFYFLYSTYFIFYILYSTLYISYILYSIYSTFCILYILFPIFYTLHSTFYILHSMFCILYSTFHILALLIIFFPRHFNRGSASRGLQSSSFHFPSSFFFPFLSSPGCYLCPPKGFVRMSDIRPLSALHLLVLLRQRWLQL